MVDNRVLFRLWFAIVANYDAMAYDGYILFRMFYVVCISIEK